MLEVLSEDTLWRSRSDVFSQSVSDTSNRKGSVTYGR